MNQIKRAINHKLIIALLFVLTAFTISAQNEPDILGPVEVYAGEAASYTFSEPTNTYFPGGWESDGELLIEENQYTGYLSSMDVVWHTTGPHVIDITYLDSSGSIVDYVTLDVQVLYQPAPTPPAPRVISNTNGTVTLGWALGASPPQDVEWHWQSASDGETRTTTSSNSTIGLTSSGTCYLRAYNTQTYDWSDSSSSISFVVASPPKWYYDSDGDGFGNTAPSIESWTQPSGYVDNNFDFCPSEYGLYSGCPDENNENYVRSITYQNPYSEADLGNTIPFEDKIETITYFDGLGRAKQNINIRAGGNSEDIITHIEYDAYGRQDKEYLPYPLEAGGGLFRPDAKTATETFYYAPKYENTSNPFSEKSLEASPLNRVMEQGAPGADWAVNKNSDSDHTIKFEYTTNKTEDYVKNYGVSFQPNYPYNPEDPDLDDRYIYSENELYKTITKDENWQPGQTYPSDHTTEEYKDKEGRVVLKRTFNKNKWHDTYYVYDEHGNLTYVLPPQVSTYRLLTQQNWAGQNFSFKDEPNLFTGAPPYNNIYFYFLPNGNLKIYVNTYGSAGIGLKEGLALNLDFLSPTLPDMNLGDFTDYYNGDNFGSAYIQGGNLYFDSTGFVTTSYTEVDLGLEVDLSNYQTSFVPPPIDQVQLDDLAYQYKYDKRNRLIEKKIPGKDKEEIVYNKLDQPVFTRDANLKSDGKWLFTKYDAHGRVVYTGVISSNKERGDLQDDMDGVVTLFETKTGANSIAGTTVYYSNNALPSSVSISEVYTINYYDNYTFDGFTVMPQTVYGQSVVNYNNASNTQILTKGLATGSKVKVLGSSSHWITTINGYDEKGRSVYTKSENPYLQTTDIVESKLDFTGKVIESKTNHERAAYVATDIETIDNYEYDHVGRLISQKQNINNQGEELIVKNHYDELGQLVKKGVGNVEASPLQELDYTYNIRGWLKTINDPYDVSQNGDLFRFGINYNDPQKSFRSSTPLLYNGNISDTYWKTENTDSGIKAYNYQYDALNRLDAALFYKSSSYSGQFNEYISGYDRNGNIFGLSRRMINPSNTNFSTSMDALTYSYDGNRLKSVSESSYLVNSTNGQKGFKDGNTVGDDYDYDDNGNMIEDKNKGITSITYNHLNLPTLINVDDGGGNVGTISYIYDATGTKLTKMTSNGSKTIYAGNYIYQNNGPQDDLKFFNHPEGYVEPDGQGNFDYIYQYKDHLGNVRLSYSDTDGNGSINPATEILQERNYYPFGLEHKGYNNQINGVENNYKTYNGKEKEEELDLNTLAYGWRDYDPAIGRFNKIDRFSEKYYSFSPYSYAGNNPIYFIDVAGDSLYVTHRKGFLGLGGKETLRYENGKLYNSDNSEYTGKVKGFLGKVTTALGEIAKGQEGSSMISELQASKNSFTIQKGSKSEHKATENLKAYANQIQTDPNQSNLLTSIQNNGTNISGGSGADIFWNPSGSPLVTTSGTKTNATTDLAHEMFHGLDANRGLLDDRLQNGVKRSEWQATYRENTLRVQLGLPTRTHYKASLNQSTGVRTGIGPRMLSPAPTNSPILPSWYTP